MSIRHESRTKHFSYMQVWKKKTKLYSYFFFFQEAYWHVCAVKTRDEAKEDTGFNIQEIQQRIGVKWNPRTKIVHQANREQDERVFWESFLGKWWNYHNIWRVLVFRVYIAPAAITKYNWLDGWTTEMYFPLVLKARLRCHQDWFLLKPLSLAYR